MTSSLMDRGAVVVWMSSDEEDEEDERWRGEEEGEGLSASVKEGRLGSIR